MGALLDEVIRLALGRTEFHASIWLGVTLMLAAGGALVATIGRSLSDPIAVEFALRPSRAVKWMFLSAIIIPAAFFLFVLTVFAAPAGVVMVFAMLPFWGLGYVALALVTGDRLARALGVSVHPALAVVVAVLLFRSVHLIPEIGTPLHSLIAWYALGGAAAVGYDVALSWHRRRLPDHVQFEGERLTEWDPTEGPRRPTPPPVHPPQHPGTSPR